MKGLQRVVGLFQATLDFSRLMSMTHSDARSVFYGVRFITRTEGDYFERSFAEFSTTPQGLRVLAERPDTRTLLQDQQRLAACPPGSLGRLYFEFMQVHGLDPAFYETDVLRRMALAEKDGDRAWYRNRLGRHHDLYHVLMGYGPTTLGEACLMLFRAAQTKHRGVLVLALAMTLRHLGRPQALPCLLEAYRRGRRATMLEMLPWEHCLELPLATARSRLGIVPAQHCPADTAYALDAFLPVTALRTA